MPERGRLDEPLRLDRLTAALAHDLAESGERCTYAVLPVATEFGPSFVAMLRERSPRGVSVNPCLHFSSAVDHDGTLGRSKLAYIHYEGRRQG